MVGDRQCTADEVKALNAVFVGGASPGTDGIANVTWVSAGVVRCKDRNRQPCKGSHRDALDAGAAKVTVMPQSNERAVGTKGINGNLAVPAQKDTVKKTPPAE